MLTARTFAPLVGAEIARTRRKPARTGIKGRQQYHSKHQTSESCLFVRKTNSSRRTTPARVWGPWSGVCAYRWVGASEDSGNELPDSRTGS